MQLIWQGKDITQYTQIRGCIHREAAHGAGDLLEIRMGRAESWHRWDPETDDTIRVKHKGYDTGTLYLHSVIPEGEEYRVLALSLKSAARRRAWAGYRDVTLRRLLHNLAAGCGMKDGIYGTEGLYAYPWAEQRDEGAAAFLDRMCRMEGMALKTVGGAFRAIDIRWAQNRTPAANIVLKAGQDGARWQRNEGEKWGRVKVITPWAESSATDTEAMGRPEKVICCTGARDAATAGRWARGLLLDHNREAETLEIEMGLNAKLTAMERITIGGNTAANGDWLVDEAEHNLIDERTTARLLRALRGIR